MNSLRPRIVLLLLAGLAGLGISGPLPAAAQAGQPTAPPSQVQVARRFLLAVLAGDWEAAYEWLSPATRQELPAANFRAATMPLIEQARRYGPTIDLYKLGYRLRDGQIMQPFVAFTYRADSLRPGPRFQLDITFPDSSARQIQEFHLIQLVK